MEEEGEALCARMTARVRNNQQHLWFSEERSRHGGAGRRKETRRMYQTSPNYLTCQGPEIQTVPPQLVSMLRLKTFKEDMRRAAEVELHDPAVCGVCEQEQASLALTDFIRRKKTQLQECVKPPKALQCPSLDFGRNYLVEMCGSQQPGVALATAKERGVALATDEMRGYPDKKATETHLARPCCAFSDR